MRVGPLKLKAQLYCGEDLAMGPGKADLLEAIGREGSISAAGRALGMSYRRAWLLVDTMNRCWTAPLVETQVGGGSARGAVVTSLGKTVLDAYRAMEGAIATLASADSLTILTADLLSTPRQPARSRTEGGPD